MLNGALGIVEAGGDWNVAGKGGPPRHGSWNPPVASKFTVHSPQVWGAAQVESHTPSRAKIPARSRRMADWRGNFATLLAPLSLETSGEPGTDGCLPPDGVDH